MRLIKTVSLVFLVIVLMVYIRTNPIVGFIALVAVLLLVALADYLFKGTDAVYPDKSRYR